MFGSSKRRLAREGVEARGVVTDRHSYYGQHGNLLEDYDVTVRVSFDDGTTDEFTTKSVRVVLDSPRLTRRDRKADTAARIARGGEKLADLHDRGALTDAEVAAPSRTITDRGASLPAARGRLPSLAIR